MQIVHKMYNAHMIAHTNNMDIELIKSYLRKLGLEPEVADVYIALATHGPQSISELARSSGVERTRIYRLADELMASTLVEVESHYKRNIYKAAPITNVQILLAKKEQEMRELQTGLSKIKDMFVGDGKNDNTRVQFYDGFDGAKQLFWNETKAEGEMLCILRENMQTKTNSSFFERWVRRCNERNIAFRGLVGDDFVKSQQEWYGRHSNERLAHWEARYLPDAKFPITHSTVVYNDVVAHYNWQAHEVFALEIHNREVAETQRRYFELLWNIAEPIDDLTGKPR